MDALKIFKTALLQCSGLIRPIRFGTKLIIYNRSNKVSLGGRISAWHGPRNAHDVRLLKNHGEGTEIVIFPTQVPQAFSPSHQTRRFNISHQDFAGFYCRYKTDPCALFSHVATKSFIIIIYIPLIRICPFFTTISFICSKFLSPKDTLNTKTHDWSKIKWLTPNDWIIFSLTVKQMQTT